MKRILPPSIFAILFTFSCSDETTIFETSNDDVLLETSSAILENSIHYDESGVLDIYEEDQSTNQKSSYLDEQAGDYPLTLVAQIDPPSFSGGENLTASHVDLVGDYVYVSYNTVDDGYVGGVDIIYVGNPNQPIITSRLYYLNADINSLKYDSGYVYAVGGVDSETSVRATSNSFVVKLPVFNGTFDISSELTYGFQEGFTANDVVVNSNNLLVTSGSEGYITEFDKQTLEIAKESAYLDLRSLAVNNGEIAVLDASFGVRFLDANLSEVRNIAIDSDFRAADKRTLDISDDKVVVAEGSQGAGIYNANSGALMEYVPITIHPDGVEDTNVVTNAIALNEDVMLMANGGAGLSLSEDNGTMDVVGVVELEGSINYVASKGDYIFAASGKRGLQIIKLNKPDESLETKCSGTPLYSGSSNLSVTSGQEEAYSGSLRLRSITVAGNLLLCGTWTVRDAITIDEGGLFEMSGVLVVARNNRRRDVIVSENATFRVEGDLIIYGDLIIEDGASLEFLGQGSTINVYGDVEIADSASVTGDFEDIQDKF